MKHRILIAAVLCVLAMVSSGPMAMAAQAGQVFFEALYDVPVMPGLDEVDDQSVLFDKPDGRIASAIAASRTLAAQDISRFYEATLPQLGWRKTGVNQYVRDGETLRYDLARKESLTVVRFTIAPTGQ